MSEFFRPGDVVILKYQPKARWTIANVYDATLQVTLKEIPHVRYPTDYFQLAEKKPDPGATAQQRAVTPNSALDQGKFIHEQLTARSCANMPKVDPTDIVQYRVYDGYRGHAAFKYVADLPADPLTTAKKPITMIKCGICSAEVKSCGPRGVFGYPIKPEYSYEEQEHVATCQKCSESIAKHIQYLRKYG